MRIFCPAMVAVSFSRAAGGAGARYVSYLDRIGPDSGFSDPRGRACRAAGPGSAAPDCDIRMGLAPGGPWTLRPPRSAPACQSRATQPLRPLVDQVSNT